MADVQQSSLTGGGNGASRAGAASAHIAYMPISATDTVQFTEQVRDWNFEFTQLKPGKFRADGGVVDLSGVYVGRAVIDQTLLHRSSAPRGMIAVFAPGAGSGPLFANNQLVESGQCVTLAPDASVERITHGYYVDVAYAFDMEMCRARLDSLNGGSIGVGPGATVAAPGVAWIDDMLSRVERLFAAVEMQPQCLNDVERRASLAEHVLAAMAHFDTSPVDVDSTTRSARAARRIAVRLARDFIHTHLPEPLRLSELCRHAQLKIRSLEYGFREVTGLTPIAYIRSLRLNAARRTLLHSASAHRSISQIAMDTGFWHLSQFATDYRLFFGETPTETRRRGLAMRCTCVAALI